MSRHLALVLLLAVAPAAFAQEAPAPARPARPAIYDEHADGRAQIDAALALAQAENRRVLVQWGANWCGWCHLLHETFRTDKAVARELQYEYDLVLVDIGQRDRHMDLARSFGVDLEQEGVPFLTVLGADGRVLANQETGSLEMPGRKAHDPARVLKFLKAHEAPQPAAEAVYEAALAAAGDSRTAFVHFGAPWCPWCHRLDGWMRAPENTALLGKAFVDCKIDVERTQGGAELLAKLRGGEGGGIPWFAFVSGDGRILATSDGPEGNVGFPVAGGEVAHFADMLETVPGLDAATREALLASLRADGAREPAAAH